MTDEKSGLGKTITPLIIAGVIGLAFVQYQTQQEDAARNVGQLPAMLARLQAAEQQIAGLSKEVDALDEEIGGTLNREAINAQFDAQSTRIEELSGQVARRIELEVKDPIYRTIDTQVKSHQADVARLWQSIEVIERKIDEYKRVLTGIGAIE